MAVIVVGDGGHYDDTIFRIAEAMKCTVPEIVKTLDAISEDDYIMSDVDVVHLPPGHYDVSFRLPEPIYFPCFLGGYSYHPNHGEPCDHLWVDPSDIHDQLCVLAGYFMVLFHRKCFMQLKTFSNLRFK